MKNPFGFCTLIAAVVCAACLASSEANAQTPILSFSSSGGGWGTWVADDAKATVAPDNPAPESVTNLLQPANIPGAWNISFAFPDQSKASIDGDSLCIHQDKVGADPWLASISQTDLPIKEGQAYVLSFNAKADKTRPIFVTMQNFGFSSGDWHDLGLAQDVQLSSEWQSYSYSFTASKLTQDGSALFIHVGQQTGAVWVSGFSLKPASGTLTLPVPSKAVKVSLEKPSDTDWHVQYISDPFDLIDGHKYALSYMIKSDVPRKISCMARLNCPDWHAVSDADWSVSAAPAWRSHRIVFTAKHSMPGHNVVVFNLGGSGSGSFVSIGDVKMVDLGN
ncbi:MAG: carbohydrate binding domain-containing protein [Capsulimonadaceae bacterium]|nr:carbohydrate binding domain-containing protein [Capsulimonadaceae bacterium]